VPDYGESWDENNMYTYVDYAFQDYRLLRHPAELADYRGEGPIKSAYYLLGGLAVRFLTFVNPAWSSPTSWHFIYFGTFLLGAAALYLLELRWMSTAGALAATLLYITQPLFWGHAFINPKDVPMTALFIGSVYFGLRMTDNLRAAPWIDGRVIPAAVVLGVATGTRIAAPLAGLIVLAHIVYRLRSKSVLLATSYVLLTAASAYLSWPFFWGRSVSAYVRVVQSAAHFEQIGSVFLAGKVYEATQLPWNYFPTLVGIQLTEPALLLFIAGLAFAIADAWRGRVRPPLLLLVLWCVGPVALIICVGSTLYHNGRQIYFLLPPIFIVCGLAFERLLKLRLAAVAKVCIVLVALVPGILASVSLHPYEYVYYNSLVAGTRGARGQFELDYWATSYRELALYANAKAAPGSRIWVRKPAWAFGRYLRPDLQVVQQGPHDYAAFPSGWGVPDDRCPDAKTAYAVQRQGVIFSFLKITPDGTGCSEVTGR
jgi:hypothetical protein